MAFVSQPLPIRTGASSHTVRSISSINNGSFVTPVRPLSPTIVPAHLALVRQSNRNEQPTMLVVTQPNVSIVTGASSSIGLHAAKELAARGDHHVVMAVRNEEKARINAKQVGMKDGTYTILPLDLSRLDSVHEFVRQFQQYGFNKISSLVCNAATWHPRDKAPRFTPDGFDETVQVNHLGHFLLVNLLLNKITLSRGRVVFLATQTHNPDTLPGKIPPQADLGDLMGMKNGFKNLPGTIDDKQFEPTKAYKDSKVCNILTMRELNKRFPANGITFSAIFPGCIAESNLFREKRGWFRWFFPVFQKYITKQYVSVEEAGRRVSLVAADGKFSDSGVYWQWRGSYLEGVDKTRPVPIDPTEREAEKAQQLWDLSAKLVGLAA